MTIRAKIARHASYKLINYYHARETVETIDQSTVHECGQFLEVQKPVKNTKLHLYKESGNIKH